MPETNQMRHEDAGSEGTVEGIKQIPYHLKRRAIYTYLLYTSKSNTGKTDVEPQCYKRTYTMEYQKAGGKRYSGEYETNSLPFEEMSCLHFLAIYTRQPNTCQLEDRYQKRTKWEMRSQAERDPVGDMKQIPYHLSSLTGEA